ncbi:hypothetical protein Tco_1518412 [Tanacetum coccineum]
MFIEQSHDDVYSCLKGGSGNSRGKRLAISMVEEAWLSEKRCDQKTKSVFVEEKKMFSSKRKNVFVEEKDVFVEEKRSCSRKEKESVLTNVVKRLE